MTFEEEFSEAYQNWEIERLYLDLANALGKDLSPNAKIFLRGVLCANSPNEIAKKLNYQSKNISDTVRQTLSKEVYPAIEKLVNSGNKINWRKTSENSVSQLLKDYRKKPENLPPTPTEIKIDWREVCAKMLEKQQTTQQLRRKATQIGCEVEVFVELGLVERKLQQRHSENNGMEKFREKEVITRTYEYDEFLLDVIQRKKNKCTAIVGEAGSGKTTWLDKIATYLKNTNDLYICIPLGELQGKTLEEYILEKWLSNALLLIDLDIDLETLKKPLIKLLQKNEVWLLLDGVDEIGETSAGKTLRNIQQQLTGLLSAAQVVLTCRTNVWDVNFNNPLSGFQAYKILEFKLEQVDNFIHQWFVKAENEKLGKKLEEKLKESRHERIYDLVRNPLRLSLLCQIFYFDENSELPETKAGLYKQFIRYFYEWKPEKIDIEWKPEKIDIDWNFQPNLKNQLHQFLGRVALAGLDSSERFWLSESLVHKEVQDDNLLKLALDLDLLVLVDREFKTGECVYGFFDSSFQEYFAALTIDDWDFFIPRAHVNKPFPGKKYRIFESQWKEVILIWLGTNKTEVSDIDKLEFIKLLVNFNDGVEPHFDYQNQARCLALYVIGECVLRESQNQNELDEIIFTLVKWFFTIYLKNNVSYELRNRENIEQNVINSIRQGIFAKHLLRILDENIYDYKDDNIDYSLVISCLGEKSIGNDFIVEKLIEIVVNIQRKLHLNFCFFVRISELIEAIGKICNSNNNAINTLNIIALQAIKFDMNILNKIKHKKSQGEQYIPFINLHDNIHHYFIKKIIESLGKIGSGNQNTVNTLTEIVFLIKKIDDNILRDTCSLAAQSLWKVNPGNINAIQAFKEIMLSPNRGWFCGRISITAFRLLEIADKDTRVVDIIIDILKSSNQKEVHRELCRCLGKINVGYEKAIGALIEIYEITEDEKTRRLAVESLSNIGFGSPLANKFLEEVLQTSLDQYVLRQAAESLGKVDPSNSIIVTTLKKIIETTKDKSLLIATAKSLWQVSEQDKPLAIQTLNNICYKYYQNDNPMAYEVAIVAIEFDSNNHIAMTTLTKALYGMDIEIEVEVKRTLIELCQDRNQDVINFLVNLLESQQEYEKCLKVAEILLISNCCIEQVKTKIIQLLSNLSLKEKARFYSFYKEKARFYNNNYTILDSIISHYPNAVFDLIKLIEIEAKIFITRFGELMFEKTGRILDIFMIQKTTYIIKLGEIGKDNPLAIKKLIEILIKDKNYSNSAVIGLKAVSQKELIIEVVKSLKDYLQNPIYEYLYKYCYQIIWHYTKKLPYPEFYNIWNEPKSTIQHLNFTQLPTTIRQNIANNPNLNLNQTIIPICIDGANFTNPDNPAPDIYIEMIEKGCPEITETPTTMSSLKTYWRLNLKKLNKQITLIFYTSKSDRSFSETFLTTLSTLCGSICLISDQKCDNIECISPHHPNLIDTIIKWLRREILEA